MRRDVEIRICDRCKKEIILDRHKSGYSEALRAWKEGPIKDTDERCGKAYEAGPNTHYCKECRKEIRSVAAKKRNLSDMGHAARKEKANERKNDN